MSFKQQLPEQPPLQEELLDGESTYSCQYWDDLDSKQDL